ncbi:Kinesin-related motor protein [Neonectria magnoliae]|uniref:Kinesin-related motor protein n=1 Tax=Neonectria magnoliae TaxID=2732573 RepID=A0ABR1H258_9HYPO
MVASVRAGAGSRASAKPTTRASATKHLLSANAARAPQREGDSSSAQLRGSGLGQGIKLRCRGRNEREVRENSLVAVNTDGVEGRQVDVRMRTDLLDNKTYDFDRVFSQAADQSTVFDDTVKPILDETGTGKTYTMSGDMTDTLGILSHGAGQERSREHSCPATEEVAADMLNEMTHFHTQVRYRHFT